MRQLRAMPGLSRAQHRLQGAGARDITNWIDAPLREPLPRVNLNGGPRRD